MIKSHIYLPLMLVISAMLSPTQALSNDVPGYRHTRYVYDRDRTLPHTQVWGIASGGSELFLATNDGLFRYDGVRVESLKEECNTIIRAVKYDGESGRLYSAGVNSFGWWDTDCTGDLKYHQLFRNAEFRSNSYDFWRIGICGSREARKVCFQCREKIVIYGCSDGSMTEIRPERYFRYMHQVGDRLYVQDGDALETLTDDGKTAPAAEISGRVVNMVQGRDGMIAAVEDAGLLLIGEDGRTTELDPQSNRIFKASKITDCRRYDDEHLLVGTTMHGLFITDLDGKISSSIRIDDMLDNSTVLCAAADHAGNIWVGLDSGAAMIDNSSCDYYMSDNRFGQIHEVFRTGEGTLLVGSNKGLFLMDNDMNVRRLTERSGSVWDICEFDGNVFIANDTGLYLLTDSLILKPLYTDTGVFCMHRLHSGDGLYILGTYSGLAAIGLAGSSVSFCRNILDYNGFTRFIAADDSGSLWVTVPKTGFVRLKLDMNDWAVQEETAFDLADGPDMDVFSTEIDGRLFLCAGDKAYEADSSGEGVLQHSKGAEDILRTAGDGITSITQNGNRFWYISSHGYGYVEREGTELVRHHGILKYANSERVTRISPYGEGCAIGYRNGIGFSEGDACRENRLRISKVVAQGSMKDLKHDLSRQTFTVPYTNNTISIYVSCTVPGDNEIQYRLSSDNDGWRTVCIDECIQLPSLAFGRHHVEIRSASCGGTGCSLDLRILPPWYVSWQMCLVYLTALCILLLGIRRYYRKKNRKQKEEEIKRLEYENLVKEKRISEIERENLRNELKYKGQELANITLNNSRRNNLIGELISKLQTINSYGDAEEIRKNASSLILELEAQLKDESDWHKSEEYFNTIYDGLLDRLKSSYPALSKTDLKLCVYIKLNMSTKEIADLMNISPRSVEMARYRLRKKLGLKPEEEIASVLK